MYLHAVYLRPEAVYLMGGKPSKGTPADKRKRGRGEKPGPKPKR